MLKLKIAWKGKGLKEIAINKDNGKTLISVSKIYYRPLEVDFLKGDVLKPKRS